jgi:hypothetical protein
MQFAIEYLRETTDEYSVCSHHDVDVANLACASARAWEEVRYARGCGATGFQIRNAQRYVVAIEEYDQLPGSQTIH